MENSEIKKALETFIEPGAVAELRVVNVPNGNGFTANYYGYFNDLSKMEKAAKEYDGKAPAVYFTIHKCKDALLARASNRMVKSGKKSCSTSDHDIERLKWFMIDADAKRPAGVSSTDEEHEAAIQKTRQVYKYLRLLGFPDPISADSGNGSHLCYRIDMANTPENVEIIKLALLFLHQKFSDDVVDIDRTVHNPSRIWKLYGTLAKKGDATEKRKHRRASVLFYPQQIEILHKDYLMSLAAQVIDEKAAKKKAKTTTINIEVNADGIDPEEWCNKYGLSLSEINTWRDTTKYKLSKCPFNDAHEEAVIFKHPTGAVSFKCFHNGCAGYDWHDLREMFEPESDRQIKKEYLPNNYKTKHTKPEKTYPKIEPRIDVWGDMTEMERELELQMSGESVTIPLPWRRLSDGCKAFRPGSLTILAGPLKTGKSFFTQNIIKHINDLGYSWAYLPLEDSRTQWMWRQLAILEETYKMIDVDQEGADYRMSVYLSRANEIEQYLKHVSQNPRVGIKNESGQTIVPQVPHKVIVDWIREQAPKNRFLVVDPVSQIDSDGNKTWEEESWFMRQVLGILADTQTTLLLVTHTIKRAGAAGQMAITAEDVQGSSMFVKLAHTTLLIDACEMQSTQVYRTGGKIEPVEHDRVVAIAAARNGGGSRTRLAFLQNKQKPIFEELGIIAPKK